jgi:hypothetical protein
MSTGREIKMRRGRWIKSKVVNGTLENPLWTVAGNNQTDWIHLPLNQNHKVQRRRLTGPALLHRKTLSLEAGLEGVIRQPTEGGAEGGAEAEEAIILSTANLEHPQAVGTPLTQLTIHPHLQLNSRMPTTIPLLSNTASLPLCQYNMKSQAYICLYVEGTRNLSRNITLHERWNRKAQLFSLEDSMRQ